MNFGPLHETFGIGNGCCRCGSKAFLAEKNTFSAFHDVRSACFTSTGIGTRVSIEHDDSFACAMCNSPLSLPTSYHVNSFQFISFRQPVSKREFPTSVQPSALGSPPGEAIEEDPRHISRSQPDKYESALAARREYLKFKGCEKSFQKPRSWGYWPNGLFATADATS